MIAVSTASRPTVWVTRTEPSNSETRARLRAMDVGALGLPVLLSRPVVSSWPGETPDALVFTSPLGVRSHCPKPRFFAKPVYTVGDRTALAAVDAGYINVRSARGNVDDLEALIRNDVPSGRMVCHLSARQPAGSLLENLSAGGYRTARVVVYETRSVAFDELSRMLPPLDCLDGILVHSPRAGHIVRHVIARAKSRFDGTIFCISAAASKPFGDLKDIRTQIAVRPDETSLLALVANQCR